MTNRWAITIDKSRADALGVLRLEPGIEVHEEGEIIWVRGELAEGMERRLAVLPAAGRFTVGRDGELAAQGCRVPQGWLPDGRWVAIRAWLTVLLPTVRPPSELPSRTAWRMIPAENFAAPNLLLADRHDWCVFGTQAAQVRLDKLRFAIDEHGRVAIHGEPLPAIPGEYFVEREGVALPVGKQLSPRIPPTVVRQLLQLAAGDVALLLPDRYELIRELDFVSASRSAIRASPEPNHA